MAGTGGIRRCDLVVLGSGAGGLTAALTAALEGLDVIVLEHEPVIGGTSARSSGTVWVPDNRHMRAHGMTGDRAMAETYLAALVGERERPAMWRAFLDAAPLMLADLEDRAGLGFRPYLAAPDYRQDKPGAAAGGRPLEPLPFDGRDLGEDFARLASPLPELMLFGGMMITRAEAARLVHAEKDPGALWLGLKLVARYLVERLRHPRGLRLVLGNALVGHLLKALQDRKVPVLTGAATDRLILRDGRVCGVEAVRDGRALAIEARCGVVLAGGGFPADPDKRARHLPAPVADHTPAAPGCVGRTLDLALAAGAVLGPPGRDNALWFPSSVARRRDGTTAVYPHIVLDRSKPGLIAVDACGRRFANEAVSYHEFVRAMYAADASRPAIPAWLVVDRAFIRRYGLGLIRPRTPSLRSWVDSGYLHEGNTVADLARTIGLPADELVATVARYNGFSADGVDRDFGKGGTVYDRSNGDPTVAPNPCLGPIAQPPFYAVAVWPTPLGTSRGLVADTDARVLDAAGDPIPGLYVCGNDMQSAFGGEYPGAGAQLGQAMAFAWLAARHAARHATRRDGASESGRTGSGQK
ncbi:FAD-dependent oxidoreductase [Polymorphum gilvum]|uniref:FAD-dependent oxidoreductase n=1 Tax=Polymorphum gilvum TaxID=991904 RepID=UPI0002EBDB85|nr:FAD-dependent oxidoreductase [Polymorphum gilvum]